jgi:hypothetical protein
MFVYSMAPALYLFHSRIKSLLYAVDTNRIFGLRYNSKRIDYIYMIMRRTSPVRIFLIAKLVLTLLLKAMLLSDGFSENPTITPTPLRLTESNKATMQTKLHRVIITCIYTEKNSIIVQ